MMKACVNIINSQRKFSVHLNAFMCVLQSQKKKKKKDINADSHSNDVVRFCCMQRIVKKF